MHPAFSILFFTTLAGSAQGLIVALALASLLGVPMAPGFLLDALVVAEVLLLAGLGASFLHLGQKLRAWRAVLMWRTSWMSREVIVLPAFIALVAIWYLAERGGVAARYGALFPVLALVGAIGLWYCTAMIYACLRFIEEWAHPLTIVNFTLIGLASGLLLACALAVLLGAGSDMITANGTSALGVTIAAWITRVLALRRNASIRHRSTLQSATGIPSPMLVQKSMGMSAGSFNTREFFSWCIASGHEECPARISAAGLCDSHRADALGHHQPRQLALGVGRSSAGAWADRRALGVFCAGQTSAKPVLPGRVLSGRRAVVSSTGRASLVAGLISGGLVVPTPISAWS